MTKLENIFQKWIWKGLKENSKPNGELSIDKNECDVFEGQTFYGENFLSVFENGFEFKSRSLP